MIRTATFRLGLTVAAAVFAADLAHAFLFIGRVWPDGNIPMQLQLGKPVGSLLDGSADWDAVAEASLNEWNAQIARSQFTAVRASTANQAQGNRLNNVFFSPDVFGSAWGSGVIGVTLSFRSATTLLVTESDVLFNSTRTWDSYRGVLRRSGTTTLLDLRRVSLHEFGHVLGLDHPDQDKPAQSVNAVMNSTISNTDSLQDDDISGVRSLYDLVLNRPAIAVQPVGRTVPVGGSYTLIVTATDTGPLTYVWSFQAPGSSAPALFNLATGPSYTIGSVQAGDAGTYAVAVRNAGGVTALSSTATLTVTPIATSSDTLLANLSTLGTVGADDSQQLIAGLVIRGDAGTQKQILLRAVGPALADFGVPGTLAAPQIKLVNSAGATIAQAAAWGASLDAAKLPAAFTRLGAFQFKAGSADSALLATLAPGNYTALVSGGGATGAALVEAYDADPDVATSRTRRFVNIATRGQVGDGAAMTAGLVVRGPGPHTYLIRAVGITLASAPFNLTGVLIDPFLQLYQGETLLRENDDWDSSLSAQPALRAAATQVGAFALRETRDRILNSGLDSAMIVTLQPGNYTAKVTGFKGVTGIAIVEIYEMP